MQDNAPRPKLKPSALDTPQHPRLARSAGLLSPALACARLNLIPQQLADLVRGARLRALRDPVGRLCFAAGDLDALPTEVAPEIAVAELLNYKEPPMNDAAVALSETAASSAVAADVAALINTIDELRRSTARSPKWVDIKDAVALYGVPAKTIKEWARQGWVRQSKLGPTFQSKSLYNASDINSALCRIAAGSAPICALRRED